MIQLIIKFIPQETLLSKKMNLTSRKKKKKIEPPNTFIYPHHDYLRENEIIITNEGEHEFEETPQLQEEENKIQEGISENPQRQEEVGEGIEEISLRSST
jgi:hypothetical protein